MLLEEACRASPRALFCPAPIRPSRLSVAGEGFVHFVITEAADLPGVIPQLTRSRDFLAKDGEFLHRLLVTLTPNSPEIDVQFTSTEGDLPMGVSHLVTNVTADDAFLFGGSVSGHLSDGTGFNDTILVRPNLQEVPEPAVLALFSAGALSVFGVGFRRKGENAKT